MLCGITELVTHESSSLHNACMYGTRVRIAVATEVDSGGRLKQGLGCSIPEAILLLKETTTPAEH